MNDLFVGWHHLICSCSTDFTWILTSVRNRNVCNHSMSPKTFTHNGGTWTRPDIPSSIGKDWKCYVCQKSIDCEPEEYSVQQGVQLIRKLRWIPASRYWHGYTVGIEYCSADCSLKHFQEQQNASTT